MTLPAWWQDAVAYQIYPRSFADSNGDGIGDLQGIINKLDYLQWLGVTAVWLSPFYPSPQIDVGYDVSDYTDVEPTYGTLAHFDTLIAEAHRRDIRVILDLVLNHTSDRHAWFQESKSSKHNPKRDWYLWRAGQNGGPPNDWEAFFGGSAWEFDPITDEYYYHFFFRSQPDLNWRHPEVREAIADVMRFWYERGADGFRIDAIDPLFEDAALRDSGVAESITDLWLKYFTSGRNEWKIFREKFHRQFMLPDNYTVLPALRDLTNAYPERILLGETDSVLCYGNGEDMLHSVFSFEITDVASMNPARFREAIQFRIAHVPSRGWDCNTLGSHDRSRAMTCFADGMDNQARMQVALAMTMLLKGTPMFYNGEEIGMEDLPIWDAALFRDGLGIWAYETLIAHGYSEADSIRFADTVSRDKGRTPMQWNGTANAGFSPDGIQPWLPVHSNYTVGVNVAAQQPDEKSLLHFFRRMALLRREHVALRRGEMQLIEADARIVAFRREHHSQTCMVALNMSNEAVPFDFPPTLIFSTHEAEGPRTMLEPYEVYVGIIGERV